jgi:ketosteroid isomerase-like protein
MVVVAVVAGLVGIQILGAQTDTRAADERTIRETDLAWAKAGAARDLERTLSFLAEDATEMAPNTPAAVGRAAHRKVWGDMFATPGFAMGWQPTKVEASRGGDLGYSVGTYQQTMHDRAGKPVADRGKYVTVWKKQADGTWKAVVDAFNSDLPLHAGH